jgi:hemolysin activation/secretion protein
MVTCIAVIKKRLKKRIAASFFTLLTCHSALALTPVDLPSSVNPSIIGQHVQPRESNTPNALPAVAHTVEKPANPLGAQAAKIKFKLTQIILEGNTVYPTDKLLPIYKDKLNKLITVAELQDIVQSITNYYRNSGYILSRAVIPPQHVKNGVVRVRVIEGYIDKVTVVGTPKGSRSIVAAYGRRISKSRPLQVKDMERYLFLANELPGVQSKAVLEPSKSEVGASDLALATEAKMVSSYLSYDNYGTRYIGPQQITANLEADSVFRSGDATRITYVTTARGKELKYKDLNYDMNLGTSGLRFAFDGNQATTNPLFTLQPLQVLGDAINYSGTLRYPAIRSRSRNLTLEGAFNYLNSRTTEFNDLFLLYSDRVRSLRGGVTYDFADSYRGSNLINANVVQGLTILKGTSNNESFTTSRFGATSAYTRVNLQMTRQQQLFWKFSAYGLLKGQYSFQPLLASEQFGYGGSQLGRGYDPAEIIGDRGAAASLELRLTVTPDRFLIQAIQFYAFYDAGEIWNLRNVQGLTQQSATSTGAGARFYMTKFVSGNFMYTQPLSKKVAALSQIGNGSLPRVFFSISASV